MELFQKYKVYIVRAIVGAVVAVLLHWVGGLNTWLVGAIIALIAVPASEFVEKQLDVQLAKHKSKNEAEAEGEAEDAGEEVKKTAKKTAKKVTKKAEDSKTASDS